MNSGLLDIAAFAGLLLAAPMITCAANLSNPSRSAVHEFELPTVRWQRLSTDSTGGRNIERFIINKVDSVSRLCFMQLARPLNVVSEGDSCVEINAGYYYLVSPKFGSDAQDVIIDVECGWPVRGWSEGPESFHAVTPGGRIIDVAVHDRQDMTAAAFADSKLMKWTLAADSIYRLNERISTGKHPGIFDIAPSFKKVTQTKGTHRQGSPVETKLMAHSNPEYYKITLQPDKAVIEGASEKAVTMGRRMLERRLYPESDGRIPCVVIEDWPDYPYRGLMIDIARNYQTPEAMYEIVDLMADYRLNRLHFHITDDEAWRLEIPGLPELTELGSRRGYTPDSSDYLPDIFSGTGKVDDNVPTANGYFTRKEFIDFIRHCDSIGIAVIPEVESPGHARAAIKAMEARRKRTGDETYRLIEDNDTSVYTSAQLYHDNLMNPALPGTYKFITKVVDEIAAMYKEAGVELPGIHLGGDEVPEGAWDGSPSAVAMEKTLGIKGRHAMQGEYVKRISAIMKERGIPLYGWQDICTDYDDEFHAMVAPAVGGMDCWVSRHDPEHNIALKGVKAGYPVIISNVDYFYMDMLYARNPEEKGLYWGGITDELRTLSGYPDKICPPSPDHIGKVIGVSGKLFAETIRNREDMQRLLFPKSLGLAERGWNAEPTYSDADFNILIGEKEIPRLERLGVEWHLRQPGIKIENGKIYMNSPYPDAAIHYTLDGTRPALIGSALYRGPIELPATETEIRAILVKDGKTSVNSLLRYTPGE